EHRPVPLVQRRSTRGEELKRLAIPVRPLADDALRCQALDHRGSAPRLALLDVREVDLDERRRVRLERVVDRVAVVRPRAWVDDHAVRPVERVVAPLDVLALAVRLPAPHGQAERLRPAVDPRLELGVAEAAAVLLRVAAPEEVEIDAVQHRDTHRRTLLGDQGIESSPYVALRELRADDGAARRLEEHKPDAAAGDLLVAPERGPRTVAVRAHRSWPQDVLDDVGLE